MQQQQALAQAHYRKAWNTLLTTELHRHIYYRVMSYKENIGSTLKM